MTSENDDELKYEMVEKNDEVFGQALPIPLTQNVKRGDIFTVKVVLRHKSQGLCNSMVSTRADWRKEASVHKLRNLKRFMLEV